MLRKINHPDKPETYRSWETGTEYDCFKGGFSWPLNGKHGYICVVGLETVSQKLRICIEYQTNAWTDLARKLKELVFHFPVRWWFAPVAGEYESHYESLYKVCKQEGYSLNCQQPTLTSDLQLAAQIVKREMARNALIIPRDGTMMKQLDLLARIDLDDCSKASKLHPTVVVAQLVFEFPNVDKRIEPRQGREMYPEFFERKETTDWMAL